MTYGQHASERLDHGEQYDRVFNSVDRVSSIRDRHEVSGRPVPGHLAGLEEDAALEYLQCCLSGILVLRQTFAGAKRHHRLPKLMLMTAENCLRAPAARCFARLAQLVPREGDE